MNSVSLLPSRVLSPLVAGLLMVAGAQAQEFVGTGSLNLSGMTPENLVLEQVNHGLEESLLVFIVQAQGYRIWDRTEEDPFGGPARYVESQINCMFSYYVGNLSERDVRLGGSNHSQQYPTLVLYRGGDQSMGFTIPTYERLNENFTLGARDGRVYGIGGTTGSYDDASFPSREEAERVAESFCDVSDITRVEWLEGASEGALFRDDAAPRMFSSISKVMLYREPDTQAAPAPDSSVASPQATDPVETVVTIADAAVDAATGTTADPVLPMTPDEQARFRDALSACWVVDPATAAGQIAVTVEFALDRNARLDGDIRIISHSGSDRSAAKEAFERVRRAIYRCQGEGFLLPPEKYDYWRLVQFTFNPTP